MKSHKYIPILQLVIIAILVLINIILGCIFYNLNVETAVETEVETAVDEIEVTIEEQEEQVDYEAEINRLLDEMPMKAKVDKYPVTFVLTSDGESFDGGYVGYYYYESQGPERKIWLKIETSYNEERSALYEYVNNNRIGRFEIFGPSGVSINADEHYIYYCNNDKRLIVTFELKDQKRNFIDLLERHGYKKILL